MKKLGRWLKSHPLSTALLCLTLVVFFYCIIIVLRYRPHVNWFDSQSPISYVSFQYGLTVPDISGNSPNYFLQTNDKEAAKTFIDLLSQYPMGCEPPGLIISLSHGEKPNDKGNAELLLASITYRDGERASITYNPYGGKYIQKKGKEKSTSVYFGPYFGSYETEAMFYERLASFVEDALNNGKWKVTPA